MSERARIFLEEWTRDNIPAPRAAAGLRDALLSDAHRLGIAQVEFEEEVGDLDAHLAKAARTGPGAAFRALGESGTSDA